jgi:hypothetical protein
MSLCKDDNLPRVMRLCEDDNLPEIMRLSEDNNSMRYEVKQDDKLPEISG